MQQTIRGYAVRPERGCHLWVGYDNIGLSAVVKWRELDGPDVIHLDVVGVAMRHRQPGSTKAGTIAREAIEVALSEAEAYAVAKRCEELYAEGEIHRTNSGSLRLMQSFGFAFVDEFPSGAQTWAKRVPLIPPGQE
ncbi:hypothetical protein ABT304_03965 [Nocardioides sp. NPDC000445]|uniref:hypothetical protein n=1 Tax=Nocardioides sp. NPDC000445 TaxID=3154257 RepID=UPI00332A97A9